MAHLTSLHVIAAETRLRDLLTPATDDRRPARRPARRAQHSPQPGGLDETQAEAAARDRVDRPARGRRGCGRRRQDDHARRRHHAAAAEGRATRVVTPTKKAADVAARELGVPAESVAKLVHAHGWRWNSRRRLDPTGRRGGTRRPIPAALPGSTRPAVSGSWSTRPGCSTRTAAIALLTTADEAGATIALVGDRAQLPAVGRGGVLDIAAAITTGTGGTVLDLDTVHRFTDPDYADLTLKMRAGHDPADLFDQLNAMGLVQLHTTAEQAHEQIADATTHAIANR